MTAVDREKVAQKTRGGGEVSAKVAAALAKAKNEDQVREILETVPAPREEFRVIEGTEVVEVPGGLQEVPVWGDLVQFVDITPGDTTDNSGYFRRYTGADADYVPMIAVTVLDEDEVESDAMDGGPVDPRLVS